MFLMTREQVADRFITGKSVCIVGSGPGVKENDPLKIDSHDTVIRVNNYKTFGVGTPTGSRTDIHYSFYGMSIKNDARQLVIDGVKLCWCKCPDSKPIQSEWHEKNNKQAGIDFRYIYRHREKWWPAPVHIPSDDTFIGYFEELGRHIPTTGFQAILEVLSMEPESLYITGFDFFQSGTHNVNEAWRPGRADDPIRHEPEKELDMLRDFMKYNEKIIVDKKLEEILK